MVRRQVGLFKHALLALDVGISALAFLFTFFLRQWLARLAAHHPEALPDWLQGVDFPLVTQFRAYQLLFYAMPGIWAFALYISGTTDFRLTYKQLTIRYLRSVGIGLALFVSLAFLFKMHAFARSFVVLFGAMNVSALLVSRYVIMETVAFFRHKRPDGHRMAIVGCSEHAVQLAESLRHQRTLNIKVLGHITVPGEVKSEKAEPIIGEIDHLDWLLDGQPVDEVFFGRPDLDEDVLGRALNMCDERGVDVLLPLPPTVPARSKVEIANVDGYDAPLLGLRRTPTGEVRIALKRALDIAGVGFLILMSSPIMIAVALAIKLTSRGPILFRQTRAGRNGRSFTMFKFRSMVADAEQRRAQIAHLNEMSGPVFKIRKDPRVTKVGTFIRKTSLDELPQFFNILFGDMSLVGPRPPLPSEVKQYKPWQRRRLSVKPGLTGLWQVSGRNNIDFEEWMALDLRYIDNWTLWLDIEILLRTLPAVIFKVGAS